MEGRRRREQQRMRCLDSITDAMGMNLSKLREMVKDRDTCHAAVHGVTEADPIVDWTPPLLLDSQYTFHSWMCATNMQDGDSKPSGNSRPEPRALRPRMWRCPSQVTTWLWAWPFRENWGHSGLYPDELQNSYICSIYKNRVWPLQNMSRVQPFNTGPLKTRVWYS